MNVKDIMLKQVMRRAEAEARLLAGQFVRAASEDKEAILAALEFEKWLAEACHDALPKQRSEPSRESESQRLTLT